MENLIVVDISDQKIAAAPDRLITYALGSCVGVSLYDPVRHIGGLAHVFLPRAYPGTQGRDVFKFADTAVECLLSTLVKTGCSRGRLTAKIAGGANMFASKMISIGDQNIEGVKKELRRLGITIVAEDTGLNYGRTMEFDPADGKVILRTAGKGNKIL